MNTKAIKKRVAELKLHETSIHLLKTLTIKTAVDALKRVEEMEVESGLNSIQRILTLSASVAFVFRDGDKKTQGAVAKVFGWKGNSRVSRNLAAFKTFESCNEIVEEALVTLVELGGVTVEEIILIGKNPIKRYTELQCELLKLNTPEGVEQEKPKEVLKKTKIEQSGSPSDRKGAPKQVKVYWRDVKDVVKAVDSYELILDYCLEHDATFAKLLEDAKSSILGSSASMTLHVPSVLRTVGHSDVPQLEPFEGMTAKQQAESKVAMEEALQGMTFPF